VNLIPEPTKIVFDWFGLNPDMKMKKKNRSNWLDWFFKFDGSRNWLLHLHIL